MHKISRREFGVLGLGGLATVALGSCGGAAIPVVTASGIAEGLVSAVAWESLKAAADWATPEAKEIVGNLSDWLAEFGFDQGTDLRARVTVRNEALIVRKASEGNHCIGLASIDGATRFNSIWGVPYVIAASEMADHLSKENPSMTARDIADAVLPVADFPGINAYDLSEQAFATWQTAVGNMNVNFDPDDGFTCLLKDGNGNIIEHEFKREYDATA